MNYIEPIFEKATIRGIADYLLFGLGPDEDNRDYETRLEESYAKYEKPVKKYDESAIPDLLDLANNITGETASVYMEIGLQVGFLLMQDMIENIGPKQQECQDSNKHVEYKKMAKTMYK